MAQESDYTVVHIEDDVSSWRENPSIIYSMIRDILEYEGSNGYVNKIEELAGRYSDVSATRISWTVGQQEKRAMFVFTTSFGIEECKHYLHGELTFILDALGVGAKDKLELKVFDSLSSIALLIKNSDEQVRVFTAYPEIEDELKGPRKNKKQPELKNIRFPISVIAKTHPEQLHSFILGRLGFSEAEDAEGDS